MWRDAALVAGKDLRIELRSRVGTNQVLPFSFVALLLFAFALDPNSSLLSQAAPGLYWVAVCFATVLAVQRSMAVETRWGSLDGLKMSGLDAGGVFLGKAGAVALQLLALEAVLGVGTVLIYGVTVRHILVIATTCLLATVGLATAGVLYGAMAGGLGARETLLPLLLLPVLAPVLVAAAKSWAAGLSTNASGGHPWLALLGAFAVLYLAMGTVAFGPLLESA